MRHLTALALSVVMVLLLTACGSATPQTGSSSQHGQQQPTSQPSSQLQQSADTVTGTITWPDGNPAANAHVYFNNYEPGFTGGGWTARENGSSYEYQQIAADGSYLLPGCPCADLTAYLVVPPTYGAPPDNGGRPCWIIMQGNSSSGEVYSGLQVSAGDVVDWQALDYPCSPTFYISDPSIVGPLPSEIDPSQNGGDYRAYSGTWQDAETRVNGG